MEEDKFPEVPCNVTRIASSAGGKCLQGYRLTPGLSLFGQRGGLKCDIALDVVMYRAGNLSIEASTVIFDPYKLAATGTPRQVLLCRQSARLRPGKLPRHESGGKTRVQLA